MLRTTCLASLNKSICSRQGEHVQIPYQLVVLALTLHVLFFVAFVYFLKSLNSANDVRF